MPIFPVFSDIYSYIYSHYVFVSVILSCLPFAISFRSFIYFSLLLLLNPPPSPSSSFDVYFITNTWNGFLFEYESNCHGGLKNTPGIEKKHFRKNIFQQYLSSPGTCCDTLFQKSCSFSLSFLQYTFAGFRISCCLKIRSNDYKNRDFLKKIKYKKFAIFRILCILFVFFNIEDVQGIIVIQIFYVISTDYFH